jgi:hypothetical protein
MTVAGIIGLAFAVDGYFVSEAEASDAIEQAQKRTTEVAERQQYDRVEVDQKLIALEISYLEDKLEADPDNKEAQKRLEYLKSRRIVLEQYMLELQDAK